MSLHTRRRVHVWRKNPVLFVEECFSATPDRWQAKALMKIAMADPEDRKKTAMSACKGPGKSCLLAWVVLWFLVCWKQSQIIVISITATNLKDNLWKEIVFWGKKAAWIERAFDFGAERISHKGKHKETWWVSARAFSQQADPSQQASSVAGFHAENCMIVLDEIGTYPAGVLPAAEAIFSNPGNKKIVVAGNPETVDGPLYEIVSRFANEWNVVKITGDPDDPDRSPKIDINWARAEIDKHGRENPYVMVNILGEFPPQGADQLIAVNDVIAAMDRRHSALVKDTRARIWGLDPGRSPTGDESALCIRQGDRVWPFEVWRGSDGTRLGNRIATMIHEAIANRTKPDCVFVDIGGIGASVFDRLEVLGWEDLVVPVDFGSSAENNSRFGNKRAEIWSRMNDWMRRGKACLPNDPVLRKELPLPKVEYKEVQRRTRFYMESKKDIKKRGHQSPNRADALALTFSEHVEPISEQFRRTGRHGTGTSKCKTEYDETSV